MEPDGIGSKPIERFVVLRSTLGVTEMPERLV